jgi:hypothetical protein
MKMFQWALVAAIFTAGAGLTACDKAVEEKTSVTRDEHGNVIKVDKSKTTVDDQGNVKKEETHTDNR